VQTFHEVRTLYTPHYKNSLIEISFSKYSS